jgi:hypothetical protein
VRSAKQTRESAEAPECCDAGYEDEGDADQVVRSGALAPTLEHGDQSNDEEEDCCDTDGFKHGLFSSIEMRFLPFLWLREVRGSREVVTDLGHLHCCEK